MATRFLGIVMMPFYYNAKVRSVPEYLRLRFNDPTHVLNSLSFAVATVLIAGVNLFAMALVIRLLLGWPIPISIVLAAAIVFVYITLGGLSSAIYNFGYWTTNFAEVQRALAAASRAWGPRPATCSSTTPSPS